MPGSAILERGGRMDGHGQQSDFVLTNAITPNFPRPFMSRHE